MNLKDKIQYYQNSYVPGEKHTSKYTKKLRKKRKLQERIELMHDINHELPQHLKIDQNTLDTVQYLISTFNKNFKYLHRQASDKQIILSFIFFLTKLEDNTRRLPEDFSYYRKNGLKNRMFNLIICRMLDYYMKQTPLQITQTTRYDHDLLIKNGGY